MQLSWQIALANQEPTEENPFKSYVLYFSLDDNNNEILPRIVAIDQKIPINAVKSPKKYEDNPNFVARRKVGMTRLKEGCRYFKIKDANGGTSVEWIEREIKRHYIQLQEKDENIKLVVFVDNFHDITIEDLRLSDNEKYDYIADKLSQICTQLDIPIICTAEFRKLNSSRRPTMEDIRASIKIEYEAKAIMLCYNEVGMRGDSANIYWLDGTEQAGTAKRPVFEVHVGKNKYASFKGRLFFDFRPEMAHMTEADEEDTKRYNQMIHG